MIRPARAADNAQIAASYRPEGLLRPDRRLHERLGFVQVGTEREVAYKLARWLDVVTLQVML